MAARGRILRCTPFQVTSSIYRSVRLTVTTRFVDSHNALVTLKKPPRDAALRSSYNRRRRVSRTLLQSTSARLSTGSIKATRSVTTLQTFEIRAPRKMWPSDRRTDTSLPDSPFLWPVSQVIPAPKLFRGHVWHNSRATLLRALTSTCEHTRAYQDSSRYEDVNEDTLIGI